MVTVPLKTKPEGDIIKVIAAQDSTTVNVTRTSINTGTVTAQSSFILNTGECRESLNKDFTVIETMNNHSIGVDQMK